MNDTSLPDDEERRIRAALAGFLSAGLDPAPSRAILVRALADARRSVAMLRSRKVSLAPWLASEIRLRGIRENAATLAVLEVANERDAIVDAYKQRYPQRAQQLDELVACLH
jgi:hypothetical protein